MAAAGLAFLAVVCGTLGSEVGTFLAWIVGLTSLVCWVLALVPRLRFAWDPDPRADPRT